MLFYNFRFNSTAFPAIRTSFNSSPRMMRGGYSGGDGSYRMYPRFGGVSYRDGMDRSYDDGGMSYRGGSYARGRGRNARRDSMGRYSGEGYSRTGDDMVSTLHGLMQDAPSDQIRQDIQRLADKISQQM